MTGEYLSGIILTGSTFNQVGQVTSGLMINGPRWLSAIIILIIIGIFCLLCGRFAFPWILREGLSEIAKEIREQNKH